MTLKNVQSVSPFTSPKIGDTDPQRTLGLGPGRVHRGGRTASKIPDNKAFWESVNAVEFSGRGVTRQAVYRAVAWFVALTEKRLCYAAVETIAEQARLGTTATRAHLRALERDGFIETEGDRSKGRSTTCYRLSNPTLNVANPTLSDFNPTLSVAKEVIEEGTEEEVQAAALLLVPVQEGVDEKPKAESGSIELLTQPAEDRSIDPSSKPTRHTCGCGHTWPESFGVTCFKCQRKVGSSNPAGHAAPVPGKYDCLEEDWPGNKLPHPPKTPNETKAPDPPSGNNLPRSGRLQAEYADRLQVARADKASRQYQRVDGSWAELPAAR